MDVIFDIDGTLANAEHRLHFINNMESWTHKPGRLAGPDWDSFLADENVSKDTPIEPVWWLMKSLLRSNHRVLFITGRPEESRQMTTQWLTDSSCPVRSSVTNLIYLQCWPKTYLPLFMRQNGDRRPSHEVKEEGLIAARANGYNPVLVFEDRKDDTAMWRRNGLICCQVAEGDY